ncbi:MAG: SLC45 family MFS transporter [Elusimicrobiota bacterium]|jgi:maltose/moltooligosaccharide transporter|nr:SLC45 family MFS transporter [Elusimicrobiota bacterium]
MKTLPNLKFMSIWNISFGFFGIQIAYALQTSSLSRIFSTIGADPNNLSLFWLLPPLAGLIVQPLVGKYSDRTWMRFGRRKPYLIIGAFIAIIVMIFLPNAGSLHLAVSQALIFGAVCVIFLDMSANMAMQPFKMLVGDMVNTEQKTFAYSIQSFLNNLGSVVAYIFPFLLVFFGIANTAAEGVVPDSVRYSFYIGAVILILCVLYTMLTVHEMPPEEYSQYHKLPEKGEKTSFLKLLKTAPSVFWTVGLVQFFCWAAFLFLWTYSVGAIATNVFGVTDLRNTTSEAYQNAGNWFGIVSAVQAIGAVLWSLVIPRFSTHRSAYIVSLLLGAIGFASVFFVTDKYMLFVSFFLIGCAWASMQALPFAILTNELKEGNIGTYLGLFNGTICLPQIVAAIAGSALMVLFGGHQPSMFLAGGVLMVFGIFSVFTIKETVGVSK